MLLAAGGGVFAFLASSDKLALGLALGASVMYLGFRRASAPARPALPLRPMIEVILYTRLGCHLCEEAERVLRAEQAATPFRLELVDIDRDPELVRRYGVRVPVVAVDGRTCSSTRCRLTCCVPASAGLAPIENTITRA